MNVHTLVDIYDKNWEQDGTILIYNIDIPTYIDVWKINNENSAGNISPNNYGTHFKIFC